MISKIPLAPPFLNRNDTIAISAMASKLDRSSIDEAIRIFTEDWGLRVVTGHTVGSSYYNFSDTDNARLSELQGFLNDPEIKAVFSARGGYGSSRIIDRLDFTAFYNSPKWVIGFSDITALHLEIQSIGFQSIHGPMPKTMGFDSFSNETLKKALFGENLNYQFSSDAPNRTGEGTGQVTGGNLCMLAHSIGSKSDRTYDGKILLLEDISEYLYNIDRMMVQLKRAKKLDKLAGLIIGDFSDCKDNDEPFGKNAREIILEHTEGLDFPIAFGFPFGHEKKNHALRLGEIMHLNTEASQSTLSSNLIA